MHIVFLNVTGILGGAERILLTLLKELRRARPSWKLTVVAGDDGPLTGAVEALGCGVRVLPMPQELHQAGDWGEASRVSLLTQAVPAAVRYRSALRGQLLKLAPDIVQTNGFKMHLLGAWACPPNAMLIWHVHDFVSHRSMMKRMLRWCAAKPEAAVAISPAVAQDFAAIRGARVIWNSVDLARFTPAAAPFRSEPRIGMVATFARWKGQDVFLRALALLPRALSWRGIIVGGDLYRRAGTQWTEAELKRLAKELGIEERVEFTGFLPDPAPLMGTLDIVVHASVEPEPFGLVIAEAMAAGRAVVTTSGSIVTEGVDGLVCLRGDALDLARAIERLARDPALRDRLGKAATRTAQQRFRPERMAGEFIALYEGAA